MWLDENATKININGEWIYNNKSFTVRVNVYASNEEIGKSIEDLPRMKSYTESDEDFHSEEWIDNITNIKVTNKIEIPENATQQWDVSEAGDESVMAWIVDNGTGSTDKTYYDLTIAGEGE